MVFADLYVALGIPGFDPMERFALQNFDRKTLFRHRTPRSHSF